MNIRNSGLTPTPWKILGVAVLTAGGSLVHADDGSDQPRTRSLDELVITAQSLNGPDQAPSQGSLVATQPQSVVSSDFIQNNDSPAANYTDIIKFTPSVWTVDPNGPGLMENLATSIRGFQDGQFNVTFDGIPWGDSNDFTHHSTSYFMAQDVGDVVVDRGPGDASTLGDATFGGTVAVHSADPKDKMGATGILSVGSFNTTLAGARFDTGDIAEWGGTSAFIDAKNITSNGYLSNANLTRSNVFFKVVQPAGETTQITFASNLNKLQQNPPIGETFAQIQSFGPNYAYNNDPTSQAYYGYNRDRITTDYEYLAVNSKIDGWVLDNKLYTYAYFHDELAGEDPNGEFPNGTIYGPNNVPGNVLTNNYRSVGDILRATYDLGPGQLQGGAWYDHQTNLRQLIEVDFSDNEAYNPLINNPGATLANTVPTALNSADRLQHNQLFTEEGYLQYLWHATTALDATAGLKYVSFERDMNAPVNQGTLLPLLYSETWTRALPSVDLHYKLADNWSAYAQWAKGFLAPNMNVFYTVNPAYSTLKPEGTTNVQVGTTWTSSWLTLAADVYTINFSNEVQSHTVDLPDGVPVKEFYNEGGTRYKGVEAEGTYVVGAGVSVYANASINSARTTADDTWVPDTAYHMGAVGVLYNHGPLQASLIDKYIGFRYGDSEDTQPLGGYATADAALNYTLHSIGFLTSGKLGLTLQNLLDRKSIYYLSGYTSGGTPLYFTIPGRSVQVTLTATL